MTRRIGTAIIAALMLWAVVLVPGTASAQVVGERPARDASDRRLPDLRERRHDRARPPDHPVRQHHVRGRHVHPGAQPGSQTPVTRRNAFAFSATAPYMITNWNPNVNGEVNTVACGTDGSVFVGGNFTTAGGAPTATWPR